MKSLKGIAAAHMSTMVEAFATYCESCKSKRCQEQDSSCSYLNEIIMLKEALRSGSKRKAKLGI